MSCDIEPSGLRAELSIAAVLYCEGDGRGERRDAAEIVGAVTADLLLPLSRLAASWYGLAGTCQTLVFETPQVSVCVDACSTSVILLGSGDTRRSGDMRRSQLESSMALTPFVLVYRAWPPRSPGVAPGAPCSPVR